MAILVTGGAGFIGSHTVVELQNAGYDVVVLDNLSNASEKSLKRVEQITGKPVKFYKADILDREALNKIFDQEQIDSCIHFAGLKAVGESVQKPWEYYENNISGTLTLVDVMRKHNVKNVIFSSSATVYGDPAFVPITEECPKGQCTNPYGWTKSMLEQILSDIQKADGQSGKGCGRDGRGPYRTEIRPDGPELYQLADLRIHTACHVCAEIRHHIQDKADRQADTGVFGQTRFRAAGRYGSPVGNHGTAEKDAGNQKYPQRKVGTTVYQEIKHNCYGKRIQKDFSNMCVTIHERTCTHRTSRRRICAGGHLCQVPQDEGRGCAFHLRVG